MSYLDPLLRADACLHIADLEDAADRGDTDEVARLQRVHEAPWGMPPAPPVDPPTPARKAA